jgi:2-C-methyl-D-erythritol 4-phosphate cytidylyltransferase
MRVNAAIIVAAGVGERIAGDTPKQLIPLAGEPMIVWSARALASVCDTLVVVAPPGREGQIRETLSSEKVHAVVPGGATRQESVWNGLGALPDETTHVLIHDAARPCVSLSLLERIASALDKNDAVVPVVPAVDTLIREVDTRVDAVVDREHISSVQTPQAFTVDLIARAHRKARSSDFQSSDDGSLVLALGHPVATVRGERTNIKVTFAEDVAIAEAILTTADQPGA